MKYQEIRKKCAANRYANGGAVGRKKSPTTVINVISTQPASGGSGPGPVQNAGAAGPAVAPPRMPGPAVPPAAANAALGAMGAKPAFKTGGRVKAACGGRMKTGGKVVGGLSRLERQKKK